MPQVALYHVDAFADRVFEGAPAAVVVLDDWLPDAIMQAVAAELNLAETAFVCPGEQAWRLRWFAPLAEVEFCGHATLAAAHVLLTEYGVEDGLGFRHPRRPPGRKSMLRRLPPGRAGLPARAA